MKKNIVFLSKIKEYIKKIQDEKEAERLNKKQEITDFINSTLTEEQIKHYNLELLASSSGWLGGNYNESDIKWSLLRDNVTLFTEEEYDELYYKIYPKKKINNSRN